MTTERTEDGRLREQLDRIERKQEFAALVGLLVLTHAAYRPRRKSLTDKFLDLDWLP